MDVLSEFLTFFTEGGNLRLGSPQTESEIFAFIRIFRVPSNIDNLGAEA
jgi:hypothetical protein